MKSMTVPALSIVASLAVILGFGAAIARRDTAPSGQIAQCTLPARALVRNELIFGTARPHGGPLGEEEWQSFLDSVVTPRFPEGLTVLSAYGQWRGETGLAKELSRILVIWHDRSPSRDADIEAIRAAYKERFDQESVLRIDSVSCVSF
jgi:hypothetical protein